MLTDQIMAGLCFGNNNDRCDIVELRNQAKQITESFIESLPKMRQILISDVEASYNGDSAA